MSTDRNRDVGRSILTLVSGSMLAQLATLLSMPILSRLYTPAAFGEYSLFVSISLLAAVVATLRYEMAIVLPRSIREAAALKRLTMRLLILSSVIVAGACVVVSIWPSGISSTWRGLLLLIGAEVFLLGWLSILTYWFTRTQRYGILSRNRIVLAVAVAVSQIAISFSPIGDGLGLALGMVVGQAVAATMLMIADRLGNHTPRVSPSRRWSYLLRKYWRMPALTTPQTLVDSFRLNGINFIIGNYSLDALGQYSQAWRLVNVPGALIGSAISQVYFPRLASTPKAELPRVVRSSVSKSLLLGFVPFGLIFIFSPVAVPWALGEEWGDAGLFAQALTPWLYLNLAASPVSTLFVVLGKQHVGLVFSVFYAALPIAILIVFSDQIYFAVVLMSVVQTVLLILNLMLTAWIARRATLGPEGRRTSG